MIEPKVSGSDSGAEATGLPEEAVALTVVLPVLNEADDIGRLLEEVFNQHPPPGGFEVIVADGGSTDSTPAIVNQFIESHSNLRLIPNPGRRSSAGRNVGAQAARGTYVMFLDGHCAIPRSDFFKRTVELFEESGAACLSRQQPLNRLVTGEWAQAISTARHSWLGHNAGSDIYGGEPGFTDPRSAGAAYTQEAISELGGYDEQFDACEDVEFNHRIYAAGKKAYRHPDLTVEYRPRSTIGGLYKQMFRYGRGRAHLMAKHPAVIPLPLVAITLFALAIVMVTILKGLAIGFLCLGSAVGTFAVAAFLESLRLCGVSSGRVFRVNTAFYGIFSGLVFGFWRGLIEWGRFYNRS